jgi:ribonuclease VapC
VSSIVLDASALLALLNGEPGADVVEAAMTLYGALISIVNWAEVLSKAVEAGVQPEAVREKLERAGVLAAVLRIEPVTEEDAATIARLRPLTRSAGLGLGDRACLALAKRLGAPAITVDRVWASIAAAVGVDVRVAR